MQPSLINTMSCGDLQKQLSSVLQAIKSQDYRIEDVIVDDMRHLLPGLVELDAARETITELEHREQTLQDRNDDLSAQLKAKDAEVQDEPADLASLSMELQQATRRIQLFKEVAEDANKRVERYEAKMKEALSKQAAADYVSASMEILEAQVRSQQLAYQKLVQQQNEAAEATKQQRARYQHAFNALQSTINDKDTQLEAARHEIARIESEALAISDAHTSLIDTLEADHANVSAAVNTKTIRLHKTTMMHEALQSSVAPLDDFFRRAVQILDVYQALFRNLSNPACSVPAALPRSLESSMQLAANDLLAYQRITTSAEAGNHAPHGRVGEQLEAIASNAGLMYEYLDVIQNDVTKFLGRQHAKPLGVSTPMGIASRMKRFSIG